MTVLIRTTLLASVLKVMFAPIVLADQWGSIVLAHCYQLDDNYHKEHLFIRIFWTEVGGGQFYQNPPASEGPLGLYGLNNSPVSCLINGKIVEFRTFEYRPASLRGACGLCEQTGFQLVVDDKVIWEVPAPERKFDSIFKGTIDMDRDMVRVCKENRPEEIGVEIPFEQDFFKAQTSVMVCSTMTY